MRTIPQKVSEAQEIISAIEQYECIYVYGAGRYARILLEDLQERNYSVKNIVVTHEGENESSVLGVPVITVTGIKPDDKNIFLLGVSEQYINEIVETLIKCGHKNILQLENICALHGGIGDEQRARRPKLEITAKIGCRIQCRACPQKVLMHSYFKENANRKEIMDFEDYQLCLANMPDDTVVCFSGFVEPFHHLKAIDMICFAHERGYAVDLYTTLDGLTMEQFNRIRDLPFSEVVLHTPDKMGYASIRTTPEYWKILDMALDQKKPNGKPFIDVANAQSEPTEEFLKIAGDRIHVDTRLIDRAGNLDALENLTACVPHKGKIYCSRSVRQNHWVLLPDGTVALCCMDFGLQHVIGNLIESNYKEILRGENYLKIRRQMMGLEEDGKLLCRKCTSAALLDI